MFSLDKEGIRHRAGLSLRVRLLRYDDVVSLGAGVAVSRPGERTAVPETHRAELSAILAGPPARGDLSSLAEGLRRYLAGAHGPRIASRRLVDMAAALAASDVHVEATSGGAQVRLRLEGELVPFLELDRASAEELGAALKGLSGCLPYRRDIVQEGRIERTGVCADVRASFVPTALGERIALRLFGRLFRLDELGLSPQFLDRTRRALEARTGLFAVSGGSGSGKTTTIYAALAHVAATRPGAHLSLEDPVEQRLRVAGIPVDQVELEPARGLTAEAMLVAALRQDVDVLAVGEIRTAAEARLALEAAHTGRLVIAGIHAGSAAEARQRLVDLGVEEALLATTLRAVLHQELVARPCGCAVSPACPRCRGAGRRRELHAALQGEEPAAVRGVA